MEKDYTKIETEVANDIMDILKKKGIEAVIDIWEKVEGTEVADDIIDVLKKLGIESAKDILEIIKKSPEHGNAVMDFVGEETYQSIMECAETGEIE